MDDELIDHVDKNGNVLRQITRGEAYQKGYLHPVVNILIVNSDGKIYLQRRSAKKSAFPFFWDISAAEHVASGESWQNAATRGLKEELSINTKLRLLRPKHIQKSKFEKNGKYIKEYELVEMYGGLYDGNIKIDKDEVLEGRFVTLDDLSNFDTGNFTPWGLDEVRFLLKNQQVIDLLKR